MDLSVLKQYRQMEVMQEPHISQVAQTYIIVVTAGLSDPR
jgi:hypothetical protein